MKKVLHIVRKFLPSTATFIRNQVSYHINYTPYVLYAEEVLGEMEKDLKTKIITKKAVNGKLGELVYDKYRQLTLSEAQKAINYINDLKPDIIHVHYGVDMLTFHKVLNNISIPIVVSFYGYDCTSFPKRFYGLGKFLLQRKVFENKNVKAVFAMSPDMEKDLIKTNCPKELIRIHYYGSECKKFKQDRDYQEKGVVNFTIISGLVEKKGHFILLEAWKLLMDKTNHNVSLHIIGSGELKNKIEDYIKDENIKNVRLEEPVQYGSKRHHDILYNSDVFVHPSITASTGDKEGIPGAIIEAMASGLPVISTVHAGIPSIITDKETGLLVEERNVNQLSEAMYLLANDFELRKSIGEKGCQYAINNLEISVKEIELESIYTEILNSNIYE